jgi:hypothetical protein
MFKINMKLPAGIIMQPLMTKRFFLLFLLAVTLTSCSKLPSANAEELEKQFIQIVAVSDLNKSLQLAVDSEKTFFKPGGEIALTLHNESPYPLSFDTSSLVMLLGSQNNSQWVNVKNAVTYSGDLELDPNGTILLDTRGVVVKPALDQSMFNLTKDVNVRIVIVGDVMEEENPIGEKVGAYVDVVLKP